MTYEEGIADIKRLNAEMLEQHKFLMDESLDSDDVIRAKKEIARIQHNIAYTVDVMERKQ